MIHIEEVDNDRYNIKFEGDTEGLLEETCTILASICSEMEAEPEDMLYDIAMNFIPAYPEARERMMSLSEWLGESAKELVESEGVTS